MQQFQPTGFRILPPVVKNLLIINALFFLATLGIGAAFGIDLTEKMGMHYFGSPLFHPYQLITYMFMHANFSHIFFNMFALWMFGNVLENYWGPKRFMTYYFITGLGAILIQMGVNYFQIRTAQANLPPEIISDVLTNGYKYLQEGKNFINPDAANLNILYHTPTIGASGAVFGLLLAFGMMFPNSLIYIYFAIPIKAKWFVILYGAMELFFGVSNSGGDNVAHFAHLGGMLFGFLLIIFWNKRIKNKFF
ncbi:MAG TPA: rhomboid family intramembrane serine protease [Bacteroidales bacterium]|nr:rhomboid family intramembrane serine protease [Bacteroidales bacterium]HPS16751.1 rhomboid family intramembrane serine protease [Bacteroidales bacterium]